MKTKEKKEKALIGTGLITAAAASLCCITPFLALVAGGSVLTANLTWLESLRPYLIAFTLFVLAFAWYQKLKAANKNSPECACDTEVKESFWQSKKFLTIVSVVAVLLLSVPYFSSYLYSGKKSESVEISPDNLKIIHLKIKGMTCPACNFEVNNAAFKVKGVNSAETDYKSGSTIIQFDNSKTNKHEIINSINKNTAYTVIKQEKQ